MTAPVLDPSLGSPPFPMWDGKSTLADPRAGNNASPSKRISRIQNCYDVSPSYPSTELSQNLIVGPKPVNQAAGTYNATSSVLLLCDTTAGTVTLVAPSNPYPGMVLGIKDDAGALGTNAMFFDGSAAGHFIEQPYAAGVFATNVSASFSVPGAMAWFQWDAAKTCWVCVGAFPSAAIGP